MQIVSVTIDEEALGFLFGYARGVYPREAVVGLRGEVHRHGEVEVTEAVLPFKRVEGHGFSTWAHMGVVDRKLVGIGHSHPSGVLYPSDEDMLNFTGAVMLIVGPPFSSEVDAAFFNRSRERIPFSVRWRNPERRFVFSDNAGQS
ncbi:MAG: Mov34/MPN/PAD-1 family protein [Thermoprotei archaeon]